MTKRTIPRKATQEAPAPGSAEAWAENIRARWAYERAEGPAYAPQEETGGDDEEEAGS